MNKTVVPFAPPKCPVYVRPPWIESPSQPITNKVSSSVTLCYNAAITWEWSSALPYTLV